MVSYWPLGHQIANTQSIQTQIGFRMVGIVFELILNVEFKNSVRFKVNIYLFYPMTIPIIASLHFHVYVRVCSASWL